MSKQQNSIPASKVQRATRMMKTGAKVGGNYLKHYTKKLLKQESDKKELDKKNAEQIYDTLGELKGSALKVAQMLSMDQNIMPKAYRDRFAMAQYSAPPLSGPLVLKTFRRHFGKTPQKIFDTFEMEASFAASIGQVHRATLNGKTLAVKIQYPGVADSVKSDLRMVKPVALRVMGLKEKDIRPYFQEVESMLLAETDYDLELKRSMELSEACKHIPNIMFPTYYPELSCSRVITMDWLEGEHLSEFLAKKPSQEIKDQIGQTMWNFVSHQMHVLQKLHADPHPGNYLMTQDGRLGVIDFGCVKEIPYDFYKLYFGVIHPEVRADREKLTQMAYELELLLDTDTEEEKEVFLNILSKFLSIVGKPFDADSFGFQDDKYLDSLYKFAEEVSRMPQVKQSKAVRGSSHAVYINRAWFGLYQMLSDLKAEISANKHWFGTIDLDFLEK